MGTEQTCEASIVQCIDGAQDLLHAGTEAAYARCPVFLGADIR